MSFSFIKLLEAAVRTIEAPHRSDSRSVLSLKLLHWCSGVILLIQNVPRDASSELKELLNPKTDAIFTSRSAANVPELTVD